MAMAQMADEIQEFVLMGQPPLGSRNVPGPAPHEIHILRNLAYTSVAREQPVHIHQRPQFRVPEFRLSNVIHARIVQSLARMQPKSRIYQSRLDLVAVCLRDNEINVAADSQVRPNPVPLRKRNPPHETIPRICFRQNLTYQGDCG
jgi:hypothetical protein